MVKRVSLEVLAIAENSISENEDDLKIVDEKGKVQGVNNANPKKRLKTRSLYRQPTVNELNRLQETENLFNSNLFRLQIEEILLEVQVKEKTEKKFQEWFLQLKDHLLSICEDGTEYNLTEPTLHKKLKVKLPISTKLDKTKCVFKFLKFDNVEIAGSYSLGCSINSKLKVDLQITVPADTYTKNDSINYRYHKKRAAYLACIAAHLKNYEGVENLQYSWINGCETRPVLDLTPTGKLGKHMTVRIDLKSQSEAYKLHRFSPSRNNLRESWLLSENAENNTEVGPPTPFYNSSILCDQTAAENNSVLEQTLMNSENLKQSIVLLKIWLRQRNLQVSGYIINMFIVYLVQNRRINNIMSSYQIVRNVWIALKTSEWDTKGISLCKSGNTPPIEEFHECFPVVFLDTTVTDTLYTLLARALGNRVDLILQLVDADFSWSVKKKPDKAMKEGYKQEISFGFILNPENCLNIVEKGPPANLPEAEEFRYDGSITETCVWEADTLADRRGVTRQIVDYLFKLKYGEEITELETAFSSREDKSPRLYIVTAYDGDLPSVWSSIAPSPNGTFVPSLAGYDVIIHLNSSLVPYAGEKINATPVLKPVAEVKDTEVIPVVEFDPVRKYLEELQSAYSDFALFFHDSYGGDVIAVLWKPDVHNLRDFQLTNANALVPVTVKGETKYKINTRALIEDFKILGDGLVRDVVVNS
ncbi:unnamed protein product [Chilo suppressalis]|uniref:Nucleolar protein 6 n=1 Tax=Chilo suppressalis TaxID=168631 RepID=A0ABN8AUB2_CHISP|nr:unnamed protein product [Chilo suppressalis]